MRYLIFFILTILMLSCKSTLTLESYLKQYNTDEFEIIESVNGDLNLDGNDDLAIVVSKKNEQNISNVKLIILTLTKDKGVKKIFSNQKLIDKQSFSELKMANGEIEISDYSGMCLRISTTINFKYDLKINDLFFNKLSTTESNVCGDQQKLEPVNSEFTNKELRNIKFINYCGQAN